MPPPHIHIHILGLRALGTRLHLNFWNLIWCHRIVSPEKDSTKFSDHGNCVIIFPLLPSRRDFFLEDGFPHFCSSQGIHCLLPKV